MSLLVLNHVSKRFSRGSRDCVALSDVSLEVDAGELLGVVGRRRSGRTTLLLVAAGIEPPSDGAVVFDGVSLARRGALGQRGGIAFCTTDFPPMVGGSVVEHVAAPLLGVGMAPLDAQGRAHELLRRVGASATVEVDPSGLDPTETIRVGLARALASGPRLLLVDDPVLGVRLSERDDVLELLGSIAHRDGVAIVMTVDDATELAGCDRAASLDSGELRGETAPVGAPVIPFERRRSDPRT
jgi:predicted ABC-type transport system involved in lysophospholipase L1 biosynthesis ATPase subunit